jgi:very-short-patch-repair endonuclease
VKARPSASRDRSRRLRHDQTDAERKLWTRLRDRRLFGAKLRRQHPIGPFIVDFCCRERLLVVELDGGQHATQQDADRRRSDFLVSRGYRVLRFWDNEALLQTEAGLTRIADELGRPDSNAAVSVRTGKVLPPPSPPPSPSPKEGEGVGVAACRRSSSS